MPRFEQSFEIDAPVERVFAFHERPDALALLSPAFPPVRVVSREGPPGIAVGARIELRVGYLVRWVALHTEYRKDRLFVDEQISGPFARWIHRHEFEPIDAGRRTRSTDRIEYELRGGALVNVLCGWVVRAGLRNMFAHRRRATRREAGAPPADV